MPEDSPSYVPTNIEKVFELLDNKLVTFGVPGALSFVGISKARESQWTDAAWCFVGAASIWLAIKIGKKLAPKIDQILDWIINIAEQSLRNTWAVLWSDFTRLYLQRQAHLCEEAITEGFNPDNTAIPLLEEVFVPLDLSGVGALNFTVEFGERRQDDQQETEIGSKSDALDILALAEANSSRSQVSANGDSS